MFKNDEVKKLIIAYFIITLLAITGGIFYTYKTHTNYKHRLIANNDYILESIISKYPELEDEIIDAILNFNGTSKNTISKYNLDNIELLEYINNSEEILKKNLTNNICIIFGFISLIFLFIILFLIYIYKRLNQISKYTNKVLNDDYTMEIREYSEGAISNLKNDLYKMTIKLKESEEYLKKEKVFLETTLSDISHQLKTPLTSMYVINDILHDELEDTKKLEFLKQNKMQLQKIEWLISSLLKLSRLDSGTVILKKEKINLNEMVNTMIQPIKITAELKKIDINIDIPSSIIIKIDENWTSEALLNIAKNACEHTNSFVNIEATDNALYTEIIISDDGNGIDKQDLPHIFKRFYKGIHANKNSIGIGLNMSKTIINKQNGEIYIQTGKNGSSFTIKFFKQHI